MPKKANPIDLGFLQGETARTNLSGMFAASVANESEMQQAVMVKIDRLLNNPYQLRIETRDDSIDELAQVIRAQGFQGVLIARPDAANRGSYQLTAGHRRREAAKRAGLSALPIVVCNLTDEEMVTLAITENIQREDLNPLEEGKIYLLMIDEMGYTHEQVAREVGKKRGYIENRIRVAKAPRDVQTLVQARPDTLRAVSYLVKVKDDQERGEIIEQIMKSTLTADDVPGFILTQRSQASPETSQDAASVARQTLHEERVEPAETNLGFANSQRETAQAPGETPQVEAAATPMTQHSHASSHPGPVERDAARVGNAKLQTILRYLTSYKVQSASRGRISAEEQTNLAKIKAIAEDLYTMYHDSIS
jgi:ParB family chromosome partitioning protein